MMTSFIYHLSSVRLRCVLRQAMYCALYLSHLTVQHTYAISSYESNLSTVLTTFVHELGWRELVSWEDGIQRTFEWYKTYSHRYGNIDTALVAHPRAGMYCETVM